MESKYSQLLLTRTSQLIAAAEQDLSALATSLSALRCESALSTHASERDAVAVPRGKEAGLSACGEHGYHVYVIDDYLRRAHEHRRGLIAAHGPLMQKLAGSQKKFVSALGNEVHVLLAQLTKADRQRFHFAQAAMLAERTRDKVERLLGQVGISDELLEEFYRCHRKQAYPTPDRARAQQQRLTALSQQGGILVSYQCSYCTGWHVGHASKPDSPKEAQSRRVRSAELLLQNRSKARAFFAEKGLGEPNFSPFRVQPGR